MEALRENVSPGLCAPTARKVDIFSVDPPPRVLAPLQLLLLCALSIGAMAGHLTEGLARALVRRSDLCASLW